MARGSNKYRTRGLSAKIEVPVTPKAKQAAPAMARAAGFASVSEWIRAVTGLDTDKPQNPEGASNS